MSKQNMPPRTLQQALHDGRLARSRAFHDGLSSLVSWISGGKPQGNK